MSNKSPFVDPKLKAQKSSRNAFDLGYKSAIHASLGEILPICCKEVNAGSYVEINEENQTYNINPIVRPAFARLKEHIDYFAVPKVQLWSLYDNFITGQSQYMSSALSKAYLNTSGTEEVPRMLPNFNGAFLAKALEKAYSTSNPFGINSLNGTLKILDLLGYGNYYGFLKTVGSVDEVASACEKFKLQLPSMNPMRLLAFQKVYYSYYRNSIYEGNRPNAYNIDWLPKTSSQLVASDFTDDFWPMFEPHFRWLKKDYFMSVRPSVLPTSDDIGFNGLYSGMQQATGSNVQPLLWQIFSLPGGNQSSSRGPAVMPGTSNISSNQGSFVSQQNNLYSSTQLPQSVSAIRFAFAFDKLLRRMRTAGATFDDQMLAQFGIKPIDYRHGDAYYLGGYTNRLNIAEVTQTSGDESLNGLGQFGANISKYSSNKKKISYHAKEDCFIVGVYSTSYDVDYPSTRLDRENLKRFRFDFYNPAFENLGLQALYNGELSYYDDQVEETDLNNEPITSMSNLTSLKGYVKRYLEYKTSIDEVHGLFCYGLNNASFMPWTTQYRGMHYLPDGTKVHDNQQPFAMPMMLVNPMVMDNVCKVDYSGAWENDHFIINAYQAIKVVANMSIDGETF